MDTDSDLIFFYVFELFSYIKHLAMMCIFLHEFEFGTTFSVVWCMMPNILIALKHKSQNRWKVIMVLTGYSFMSVTGKDTALAWLMPTKTAMQRITLAHSRLNLCGSPRWWSKQGYKRPTTAEERENISALNSNSSKTTITFDVWI